MKLLARYNRVNIAATILVLLVGGLCYYFILRFVLIHQLDKDLKIEEQEIKDYVHSNNNLPNAANYKDQKVVFEPTESLSSKRKNIQRKTFMIQQRMSRYKAVVLVFYK